MLTLDDIVKKNDFREQTIEVPEWGGQVQVRSLDMAARYHISDYSLVERGKDRIVDNRRFAVATLHHGLVSPRVSLEEAEKLLAKSPSAIQRILDAVWAVSDLAENDAKKESPRA